MGKLLWKSFWHSLVKLLLLFSLLLPKYLWNEYIHLTILDFLSTLLTLLFFYQCIIFFLNVSILTCIINGHAKNQSHPTWLTIFLYVSVYFCMCLLYPFIGGCLLFRDYPHCLNNRYTVLVYQAGENVQKYLVFCFT